MFGMDISGYQKGIDLSQGNYDFCIIKATEGDNYVDSQFRLYAEQLIKLNKMIGCYHFARPDYNRTTAAMKKEADFFCKQVASVGLIGKSILVLDWETEPMDREDLVSEWIYSVERITGAIPFIYGSKAKLTKWANWSIFNYYPIWMAAWPNITRFEVGVDPGYDFKNKSIDWKIWQYSSLGKYPGFKGNVDLDFSSLTKEEWKMYAGEYNKESISENMQWAIDIGLFKGFPNGEMKPQEPLTREQAASLFWRFNKYLKEIYGIEER